MKIFVTGATGFIGGHLVRRLASGGHQMHCLARQTSHTDALQEIGVTIVPGDVMDRESILAGMRGCDAVVNLANVFEFWVPDPSIYSSVNIVGTRNVMESAITSRVTKVIHVSSVVTYGNAAWPITEASEVGSRCPSKYAETKRAGDLGAWELYRRGGLPLVMVYPGGVLGPGDGKAAGRYISNLVRGKMPAQILTRSVFPWVHVRDVAEAIARALEKPGNIGEKYIVVAENLTFGDVNRMVSELSAVKLPRLTLPDFLTVALARVLTGLADLSKTPPMLDLAIDQIRTMKLGFRADGGKAAKDLGLSYTSIRSAIEEELSSKPGGGLRSAGT